jgi:hypothetical protein
MQTDFCIGGIVSWFNGKRNGSRASVRLSPPRARSENLVVEDLDDEILVYDELNARAHCLSGEAARVWRICDGQTGVEELSLRLDLDADQIVHAISELESNELLEGPILSNGATRREFSLTAVKAGAAIGAAPMIYSIIAPVPAAAASPTPGQCLFYSNGDCDNCTKICGCCCCCQGCSAFTPSCKICYPQHLCTTSVTGDKCSNLSFGTCNSGGKCSAKPRPPCPPGTLPGNCCIPPCVESCVGLNGNNNNCGCTGQLNCV